MIFAFEEMFIFLSKWLIERLLKSAILPNTYNYWMILGLFSNMPLSSFHVCRSKVRLHTPKDMAGLIGILSIYIYIHYQDSHGMGWVTINHIPCNLTRSHSAGFGSSLDTRRIGRCFLLRNDNTIVVLSGSQTFIQS